MTFRGYLSVVERIVFFVVIFQIFHLSAKAWQDNQPIRRDSSGHTIIFTHDLNGRLIFITDSNGNKLTADGTPIIADKVLRKPAVQLQTHSPQVTTTATIHVPGDQPTIQAAINAANDGDTVLVADGTYKENINFNGKAITVTSVNGPSKTTIDGGAVDSVVTFRTGEGVGSILNGFTLTNGKANFGLGSGILVSLSSPTITNNVINANHGCEGVGIGIEAGTPIIEGNMISNNIQDSCTGGLGGGGIAIEQDSSGTRIVGNLIANNSVPLLGLGGGGITLFVAGTPTIQNNIIIGNNGGDEGGGILVSEGSTPEIIGNLLIRNIAKAGGGLWSAIPDRTPGVLVLSNTIADNRASQGSAVFSMGLGPNSVFQNNLIIGIPGINAFFCGPFTASFVSNDVFTTDTTPYSEGCTDQTGTNGNISADPSFVDTADDDFHVQLGSPVINAGNGKTPVALPSTDLDGNPRTINGKIDLGSYEFQGTTTTSFSSTSLTFAAQIAGTSSPPQIVSISNTGSVALHITPFTLTGDFSETDNCHNSSGIAPGKSCQINIAFKPTVRGARTGQLSVTSNDVASPVVIQLAGTGIAPIIKLSLTSLSFPNQLVGSTSTAHSFTLSNVGDAPLSLASLTASGDFAESNNCGTNVAINGSCTVNVTFTPTARGTRNGSVVIADDALDSPQSVTLQGVGIGPSATLKPASIVFTQQVVGTTSRPQLLTLSSNGETTLAIASISTSGDFAQSNNCSSSLPSGQSCTIQVTFKPIDRGTRNGALSVIDNSTGSPDQVTLTGAGNAPVVELSEKSLAFGNQVLNAPSTRGVILSNLGDADLAIGSIAASGDFTPTNDCGSSLAPHNDCFVIVTFHPTALGTRTGTLTFNDSALDSPQSVALSGTGVQIGLSPATLNFGNQLVNTSSAVETVTVTNVGGSTLNLSSITTSAGFTETNNCGSSIPGSGSCTLSVAFAPAAAGAISGVITLSYNDTQSTVMVSGIGADFNLNSQQGGSTSATVSAGNTATYNLSLTGTAGASGSVSLSCSGAPATAICSVNPSSLSLNGATAANFSVKVSTTARSAAFPSSPRSIPVPPLGIWLLLSVVALMVSTHLCGAKRPVRYVTGVAAFALLIAGCGGSGTQQHGTPAGTYTLTVTAAAGSDIRTLKLNLTVN